MNHNDFGNEGEEIAAEYIRSLGFHILDRNWRYQHVEVDIIARDGDDLVFLEVKSRSCNNHGEPHQAVGKTKQRNLIRAANAYVEKKELDQNIRFDIVSIVKSGETKIEYIAEAFYP